MRSTISIRRPSASMIVALVALFAALGGTGYAAATINGRDIQQRSIPGNRVVNNALGGKQINESKLGVVPVAQQALTAQTAQSATEAGHATNADNATNAQNAVNAQTAQNAQQLQGRGPEAFLANSVRVRLASVNVRSGATDSIVIGCAASEKGIGGGAAWIVAGTDNPTELDAQLTASMPVPAAGGTDNMVGWKAAGLNNTGFDRLLRAYVICVPRTA
jgi:hypothetical protein